MFRNRFRQTTITILASAALAAGLGAYVSAFQPAGAASVGTAEQLEARRTAYRTHCAGCHAGDLVGRGETKGVLVGYYIQGQSGRPTGDRPPAERQALALEQGAKIHPQYPAEFETGFSVAWHRVAWNKGSWSSASAAARSILSQPERRVYFAGDHLNMNAWMQGAFESGRQAGEQDSRRLDGRSP